MLHIGSIKMRIVLTHTRPVAPTCLTLLYGSLKMSSNSPMISCEFSLLSFLVFSFLFTAE